jgi:methylenetetrahydrofolate reductase (NADPH)
MRISGLFQGASAGRVPPVSFEFFPPKSDAGSESLFRTIAELKLLAPAFVSVTWGAGGSTRRKTVELVERIQRESGLTAMAHLTCVGSTQADLAETLARLEAAGIENVLALGGDEPEGYVRPADGLRHANELARFVRERWGFCLGGACYPETHPHAVSPQDDLERLVMKVDCGVDFLITQFFFDNDDYFRFVDRARARGIRVPIVAGIMPVVSGRGIRKMAQLSGARVPPALGSLLDECQDDDARIMEVGIDWATRQCRQLIERGVEGLHFYTLNRSPATRRIHRELFAS